MAATGSVKPKLAQGGSSEIPEESLQAIRRQLLLTPVFFYTRARRRLGVRTRAAVALLVILFAIVTGVALNVARPAQSEAYAVSNTVNFQARLETAAGAIVPDGTYNVQFKLYNVSTGGTALWTESYLNSASQGITVANGYLTANLNSINNSWGAVNWNQQLYLTMNIGGTTTGAPTYDGEMSPRLKMTALPYAFQAGQLADTGGVGSTLGWNTQTTARSILLPDEAGTLCIQNSANCGFATGTTGSYIQNQNASPQTANFNITGSGTIGGTLQSATLNATSAIQLGGTNINTAGTLTNVAYLNQANTFTASQTISTAGGKTTLALTSTGSNTGITLGGDTTVYRGAAGTLSTDGNFNATGTIAIKSSTGNFSALSADVLTRKIFQSSISTDSNPRFLIRANGTIEWGDASGASGDTNLYRSASNTLKTDSNLTVGTDLAVSGNATVSGTYNTNTFTSSNLKFGAASTATIDSASGQALQLGTTNATGVAIGNTSGTVTLQGNGTSSAVNIQTAASGYINIGTNSVAGKVINVGSVGNTVQPTTIHIADTIGNATQAVTIGSTSSANNQVLIQGGTSGNAIQLQVGSGGTIKIGTTVANTITIGNTNSGQSINLFAGSGGIVVAKNNGTAIFQIQNSGSTPLFIADTSDMRVSINKTGTPSYTLDVGGDINTTGVYRISGTSGASTTCTGGQVLQNQVVNGGITTGGTCAAGGGTISLQAAYNGGNTINLAAATPIIINGSSGDSGINLTVTSGNSPFMNWDNGTQKFGIRSDSNALHLGEWTGSTFYNNLNLYNDGSILLQNSSNSATAFQIQNISNTSVFTADTTHLRIGIKNSSPGNTLSVNTLSTADSTAQVAVATGGSSNKGLVIQGAASQSANLLELQNNSGTVLGLFSPSYSVSGAGSYLPAGPTLQVGDPNGGNPGRFGVAFASGERAGFYIGDAYTGWFNAYGGQADLRSYWTMVLSGNSNGATPIDLGANPDSYSVLANNSYNGSIALAVRGASGQYVDLLTVENSTGTVLSHFDSTGRLIVGSSAGSSGSLLTIGTNTTANTGGLYFGTDTNLYRGGNNLLKTDDAFTAVGLITGNTGATISGGAINLNATTNNAVTIGSTANTNTLTFGQSTAGETINIGNGTISSGTNTINIGTNATNSGGAVNVKIGAVNDLGSTTIQGAAGGIVLQTGSGGSTAGGDVTINTSTGSTRYGDLNIGNTAYRNINLGTGGGSAINIGSTSGTLVTTIKSGTGGVAVQSSSTAALSVQNASGSILLNADTTNSQISANGNLTVFGSAAANGGGANGGAGLGASGDMGGGGGGGIGGGTGTDGGSSGDTGGQAIDVSGLFSVVSGLGYATTGPGAGGTGSTPVNNINGGNATGFGSGGGGAGFWGGNGGSGLYGGGGGGASGYSATQTGGAGGQGVLVISPVGGTNVVRTSGTSYTVPAGITSLKIWAIGAGGGGAGAIATDGTSGGAGGAGGVAYRTIAVTPGQVISYSLGTAGSGGSGTGNGNAGGATTVTVGAATITANGGSGGRYQNLGSNSGGTYTGTSTVYPFQVQNASGVALLSADTTNMQVSVTGNLNATTYSVNGTPGASLSCSSDATLQGATVISGIVTAGTCAGASYAKVYNSAAQNTSNVTVTKLTFNSELQDTDNYHSTVSNTSRLTAPASGFYHITGGAAWAPNTTGNRYLDVLLNNSSVIATDRRSNGGYSGDGSVNVDYYLNAGDYVEMRAYQESGGTLSVTANFSIFKVSANGAVGGGGTLSVGALDSQTKSSNGAVISGSTIYLQTADASSPGLVSTGAQTFAGDKTFTGNVISQGALVATTAGADQNYAYHDVLQWHSDTNNLDGALVITVPDVTNMMHITIKGYNYTAGGAAWHVDVGGYWNGSNWTNTSTNIYGSAPFNRVRLMSNAGVPVIVLGNDTDTDNWDYPQVNVSMDIAGYNNQDQFFTGWSAALSSDVSSFTTSASSEPGVPMIQGTDGSFIFKNGTDSTAAFQIQNASGTTLAAADTSNARVSVVGDLNIGSFGNRLFSDNFESGSLGLWSQGTSGNISTTTSIVHDGKYAATATPSSGSGYASATVASSSTVYARAWVYVASASTTADLLTLQNTPNGQSFTVNRATSGHLLLWNDITGANTDSGSTLTTGGWHLIELRITNGSSTGVSQVWLDGTQILNLTSQNNGTSPLGTVKIGDSSGTRTFTAYFDDVVADTVATGTASSLNVGDSFHVGGSATFGGSVLVQGTTNTKTAFQVQNTSGNVLFNVDSAGGGVVVGAKGSPNSSESTAQGVLRVVGTGEYGGLGRILIGDGDLASNQNVWIGEWSQGGGVDDTDTLQLHGRNGILLSTGASGSQVVANFYYDNGYDASILSLGQSTPNSGIYFNHNNSLRWIIGQNSTDDICDNGRSSDFYFYTTAGGCALQFTSDGEATLYSATSTHAFSVLSNSSGDSVLNVDTQHNRIGIGDNADSPSYTLDVQSSQSSDFVSRIYNTNTSSDADGLLIQLGISNASRSNNNLFVAFAGSGGTIRGAIRGNGNAVQYNTTASDFAEYFPAANQSDKPQVGDIVSLSSGNGNAVDRANLGDPSLVGVISDQAGFIGNGPVCQTGDSNCYNDYEQTNVVVGMLGQLPVNVSAENGAIQAGDPITIGSTAGVGVKATSAGSIIGYAQEGFSGSGQGVIRVYVHPTYYEGPSSASYLQNGGNASLNNLTVNGLSTVNDIQANGALNAGSLIAATGTVQNLTSTNAVTDSLVVNGNANVANLVASGTITTNNLEVGSSATVANLTATSLSALSASLDNLSVAGGIATNTLNVIGSASIGTLTVTGDANIAGNVAVGGHIITAGQTPAVQVESGAGSGATCTLTGNDTGGKITIVTGNTGLADGTQCSVTFHTAFAQDPNPVVSPRNKDSAGAGVFADANTSTMTIQFAQAPAANKTYVFNYFNTQ